MARKYYQGIDARDGMVAIEGFETSLGKTAAMVLKEIKAMGSTRLFILTCAVRQHEGS